MRRQTLLHCALLAAAFNAGCRHKRVDAGHSEPARDDSTVVAEIDGQPVTAADLMGDLANRSAYYRLQLRSADGQAKIRDDLLRFEVMAKEARDRGLDKDPEVVRIFKQQMINRLVQGEERGPEPTISDSAVEQYYTTHAAEFAQPERVDIQQIVVTSRSRAVSVLASAKALPPAEEQSFRELVRRVSEDQDGRGRAGDVVAVERSARNLPKAVVDAVFKADTLPAVLGPIETERGFYVVRVVNKVRATFRPLPEVRAQIARRLAADARAKEMDEWEEKVKARHSVRIFEDKFDALKIAAAGSPPQL
jgi:peptidyl-prolyl cis-trans isomerase C